MQQTQKSHSATKQVISRSPELSSIILRTMAKISDVVGATLGPGGHPVLIERQEADLPPIVTKDGVTVFKSLGFDNSIEQNLLEAARDASVRTAQEAGDGTTTATILAESFTRFTHEFCERNPSIPPIQVIKKIQNIYANTLLPLIEKNKIVCKMDKKGKKLLHSVAKLSANGDDALADAVLEAFEICGDDGNVTILDSSGPSKYEVERIPGYPVAMGYDESCAKYYPVFINDPTRQCIMAEKPMFLLYFGRVSDIQILLPILNKLTEGWAPPSGHPWVVPHNLVIVALGFSESVLANLSLITSTPTQLNVYPLVIPQSCIINGQRSLLDDIAAVTGGTVFDPLTNPIETCDMDGVGNLIIDNNNVWQANGVLSFECGRYRSTILGFCDEELLLKRQEEVKILAQNSESKLESDMIAERAAKLTGSIAKLKVIGSSNGELKERRDRAEDAVCAVRGALKDGALVGGGWMLVKMITALNHDNPIEGEIIVPALWEPVVTLYKNAGLEINSDTLAADFTSAYDDKIKLQDITVRDISTNMVVKALEVGILDSLPAVKEALKNAISIATLLGTLGGCVVFPRDRDIDKIETKDANAFMRDMQSGNFDVNDRAR
jgi:chaperonin GroEL